MRLAAAVLLLAAGALPAAAQTSTPSGTGAAGSARPARGPDQSSVSPAAPPATTGETTATPNPNPVVQQMNAQEQGKVEQSGK